MAANPPVIGFELGVGEFRIVTPEAVYNIKVIPELVRANTDLGVISQGARAHSPTLPPPPAAAQNHQVEPGPHPDAGFFQEISQELFDRVGQLARQLSVSVTEIPEGGPSLSQTGADLEDAKGQLEEVVEITEKASMTILDLADQIQSDMENLNSQMGLLSNLESLLEKDKAEVPETADQGEFSEALTGFVAKFQEMKGAVEALAGGVSSPAPAPSASEAPPAAPAPVVKTVVTFDLAGIFQTLYEFCTNEAVKEHIKAMRAEFEAGAFNNEAVLTSLSELAETLEQDDGFYNVPIPGILKILYANTASEANKTTLKKMNQTAASIFLEANLPVEGQTQEIEVFKETPAESVEAARRTAEAAEAEPEAGQGEPELLNLRHLIQEMDHFLPAISAGAGGGSGVFVSISKTDRDAIINTVSSSDRLIKSTITHLTRIMEALSFQDLSGQRIKKIVALISDIQVQLLSLLVSVDSKMKAHKDSPSKGRPKEETEKVAQAEVDRMLVKLGGEPSDLKGPGADNRLDQGAVNDLLAELGF
ncbi:MAG: protein phosphatase CheZ [Deltaproteobacteria bacterium]|jgi:chemotaxis regulatin CheY-phosphate phosphatase CheZ|nr:protein phosphatase CheZ [Deltaproteobacteria bacterium]